jgi:hypothetical protein
MSFIWFNVNSLQVKQILLFCKIRQVRISGILAADGCLPPFAAGG